MKNKPINQCVNIKITPSNCEEKNYCWCGDVLIDLDSQESLNLFALSNEGYILGKPKNISKYLSSLNGKLYGFYFPKQNFDREGTPNYLVDDTLTPWNAHQKGLAYLYDVYYSKGGLREINKKVIDVVERKGYILGTNSETDDPNPDWVGVYAPLGKEARNLDER